MPRTESPYILSRVCAPAAALGLMLAAPTASWPADSTAPAVASAPDRPPEAPPGAGTAAASAPEDEAKALIQMLRQRKQELDRREEALRADEQRLAALKSELEVMLNSIEQKAKAAEAAKQAEVERKRRADADERKAKLDKMVQIYEAMPVEDAAARLDKLPDRSAIELLRAMKGKTAGAILAQMKPAKAAQLSQRLLSAR